MATAYCQALALPLSSRRAISSLYSSISSFLTPFLLSCSFSLFRYPDLLNRLNKLLETISCDGYPSYYQKLVSAGFSDPTSVLSDDFFALKNPTFDFLHGVYDFRNVMMVCDLEHYLEGDILTKLTGLL